MAKLTENQVYSLAKFWSDIYAPPVDADPNQMALYLTSIAKKESTFNPNAKNKKSTARGLMQILINTQREIELKRAKVPFANASIKSKSFTKAPANPLLPDKIYDPDYAMQLATAYFAYQYKRYSGNWQKAIHAYNQGSFPGSKKSDGENYASAVMKNKLNMKQNMTYTSPNTKIEINGNIYIYRAY